MLRKMEDDGMSQKAFAGDEQEEFGAETREVAASSSVDVPSSAPRKAGGRPFQKLFGQGHEGSFEPSVKRQKVGALELSFLMPLV